MHLAKTFVRQIFLQHVFAEIAGRLGGVRRDARGALVALLTGWAIAVYVARKHASTTPQLALLVGFAIAVF